MKLKIFYIVLTFAIQTNITNSEQISIEQLLSPPTITFAQKCKTCAARTVASCVSGFAVSLIINESIKAVFENLNSENMKTLVDADINKHLIELTKLNVTENTVFVDHDKSKTLETLSLEQMREANSTKIGLVSYRRKYSFYFLLFLATPLMYKIFTQLIKEPSWTYKQILINFISQWPKIKGSIPVEMHKDCNKIYEEFVEKKFDLIEEKEAEGIVLRLVLATMLT